MEKRKNNRKNNDLQNVQRKQKIEQPTRITLKTADELRQG